MKVERSFFSIALFMLSFTCSAGDSTATSNPALATNLQTANSSCVRAGEVSMTSGGKLLKCRDGYWRYQGISGVVQLGTSAFITAADIGTYKVLNVACPATKRPVGGGCVFFAGPAGSRAQPLIIHSATTDFKGWTCAWGPLRSWADDPFPSGGVMHPAKATAGAYCADY